MTFSAAAATLTNLLPLDAQLLALIQSNYASDPNWTTVLDSYGLPTNLFVTTIAPLLAPALNQYNNTLRLQVYSRTKYLADLCRVILGLPAIPTNYIDVPLNPYWEESQGFNRVPKPPNQKEKHMSNAHSNKEQSTKIELTPEQQNPGASRASDFKIHRTFDGPLDLPFNGSSGDSVAEHRRLMRERDDQSGASTFEPLPALNEN
jgi:hypothetical protein